MAWLEGYAYRKKITIAAGTGAGTNYQQLLLVGESSGAVGENFDLESHCQNFPTDIRLTDNDETTLLDFWVEEITGTTPNRLAKVWVKVADDLGANVDTYIYYGKSADSSVSNGVNTFVFFDDFLGSSIDTGKWSGAIADCSVADSVVTLTKTGADVFVFSTPAGTFGPAIRIRSKEQHPQASSSVDHDSEAGVRTDNAWTNVVRIYQYDLTVWDYSVHRAGAASVIGSNVSLFTTWGIFERLWKDINSAKFSVNDSVPQEITTNVPSVAAPLYFRAYATAGNTTSIKLDWIFVGKYVPPEPAFSLAGGEEATGQPKLMMMGMGT
ncbi:DUF2341 domain-containing protein [Candidatus Oleimmundimicrobium sp.]|uniref:DUF2341 domain-containing protein n=1 Tax=Candidatus Oleimmundimicrobium sp. TaxID=3060597 RepID=UPI002720410C|nr:DUF2341 domain-containing protein [Candidatus Oleimmundimicrobium sp.]MDO8885769.1 DUF2341 domain-containing protein [Candidatus Oleimmundimicrobium sp.]